MSEILLKKLNLDPTSHINQSSKKQREFVVHSIKQISMQVTGSLGYEKAEVTAGGVDLQEIDPKTLESRARSGLFFAGEILDVDGRIGGFNFQWAWASGFVVGKGLARRLSY